ncbi:unnamed protein product [Rotaria magnacalcarata]|uniref:ADP ribosyltransferase domain-containing protein n=2 Tax=Rotaria magnacalcarata TaxID=392030 RepID=A0A816SA67_9BILA|nr:unnamed protein product [Rotaria magnacalcarata]
MTAVKTKITAKLEKNLETFSLLWLDAQVNTTDENKNAQKQLRTIINHLEIFHDPDDCIKYIKSCSEQDRIVLIISGRLSKELVPRIHDLRQLSSVYIYCWDKKPYKRWTTEYSKIKSVHNQLDSLILQIKADQRDRGKLEEPMSINIYNAGSNVDKSTTELNGNFIHSLLLIDVLIRIPSNKADQQKLVEFCKDEYADNEHELEIISDFKRSYKSRKALWWYTRDTFVYKMLNKALRIQNTELLLLFRFVIRDIRQQLEKNQCKEPIQVYRYQTISTKELANLEKSIGQYISINSFFSTTSNREVAMNFFRNSTAVSDLHGILFLIKADPRVVKSKPFADIHSLSYFSNEFEVLFMVGSIFRLVSIRENHTYKIWDIKMELAGDDDNGSESLFNHLKKDYGGGEKEVDLQSLGDVLQFMGKDDEAEKIYTGLQECYSSDDTAFSNLCFSLGMVYKNRKDYDRSLKWLQTALERKIRADPSDFVYIAGLHCSFGNIYFEKKDYKEAMKCYDKSMNCYKLGNLTDHLNMASLYHGVARIYCAQKKYADAFNNFQRSMTIQERYLPANHSDMALNHSGIGDVYRGDGQCQRAMECYVKAFEIRKKSLPPQHQDIASSHRDIGLLFEDMTMWNKALEEYREAYNIYRQSSLKHQNLAEIENDIQRVSSKLK